MISEIPEVDVVLITINLDMTTNYRQNLLDLMCTEDTVDLSKSLYCPCHFLDVSLDRRRDIWRTAGMVKILA